MAWTITEQRTTESERDDERLERRVLYVTADNDNETTFSAELNCGVSRGDPHPNIGYVYAKRLRTVNHGTSRRVFLTSIEYSQSIPPPIDETDPLTWDVEVDYEFQNELVPFNRGLYIRKLWDRQAADGSIFLSTSPDSNVAYTSPATNSGLHEFPVTDSAGSPIDPAPTIEIERTTLIVTRNETGFDLSVLNSWQGAVNTDYFHGAIPGQLKLRLVPGRKVTTNNVSYRPITYRFEHRVEGWDYLIQDKGFYHYVLSDPEDGDSDLIREPIVDPVTMTNIPAPVLLDGNGQKLTPFSGLDGKIIVSSYIAYRPYKNRRAYSGLGIVIPPE